MKSKKARSEGIRSGRSVTGIRVINIRRIRFAPDPRHLKKKIRGSVISNRSGPALVKPLSSIILAYHTNFKFLLNLSVRLDLGDQGISMLQGVPVAAVTPTSSSSSSSSSSNNRGSSSIPFIRPSLSATSGNTSSNNKSLPFLNTDDFFVMKASSECK